MNGDEKGGKDMGDRRNIEQKQGYIVSRLKIITTDIFYVESKKTLFSTFFHFLQFYVRDGK